MQVLTGDNLAVAKNVCQQLGLSVEHCAVGSQIEAADDRQLEELALRCTLFAKLSPAQKLQVVQVRCRCSSNTSRWDL